MPCLVAWTSSMMVDSHQRIAPMSPGKSVSLKLLRADAQGIRDGAERRGLPLLFLLADNLSSGVWIELFLLHPLFSLFLLHL